MKRLHPLLAFFSGLLCVAFASSSCWAANHTPSVTIQRAKLDSTEQQPDDGFGAAVATEGNIVVVGALNADAVYVFEKPSGGWQNMTQTATLTPSDDADHFGAAVAISGNTIVVGAPYTTVNGEVEQGAVYVFVKPAGGWTNMTQTAKLTGFHMDDKGVDLLGNAVSISGDTIVAGVPNVYANGESLGWGEALVYVEPPGGWIDSTETAVLYIAPILYPSLGVGFGTSVGISGDAVVVGANGCCAQGGSNLGAAFVYVEPTGGWATTSAYNAELTGTEVQQNDFFAESVAIDGDTVVVGSPQTDTFEVGAAYVYVKPATGWASMTQSAELYPLPTIQGNFGQSVAIRKNVVLIGAPSTAVQNSPQGVAYLFVKPGRGWRSTMKYNARLTNYTGFHYFGQSVSMAGSTAVIGFSGTYKTNSGADVFWPAR